MAVTVDMSQNYRIWDNTETVSVWLNRTAPATVAIDVALRGKITRRDETALLAVQDTAEMTWDVPQALLNPTALGRVIKRDDRITDAGAVVFAVVTCELVESGTCWHCLCKRLGGT